MIDFININWCLNIVFLIDLRHFVPFGILFCFMIPTGICCMLGATLFEGFSSQVFRYLITAHLIGLSNSYAHTFGDRPFDRFVKLVHLNMTIAKHPTKTSFVLTDRLELQTINSWIFSFLAKDRIIFMWASLWLYLTEVLILTWISAHLPLGLSL